MINQIITNATFNPIAKITFLLRPDLNMVNKEITKPPVKINGEKIKVSRIRFSATITELILRLPKEIKIRHKKTIAQIYGKIIPNVTCFCLSKTTISRF